MNRDWVEEDKTVRVEQMPLALCYAMSVHKAQVSSCLCCASLHTMRFTIASH